MLKNTLKEMLNTLKILILILTISTCLKCTNKDPDDIPQCSAETATAIDFNSCFIIEHNGLSTLQENSIKAKVIETLTATNELMDIDNLIIRVIDDPSIIIPEIGIGGFNPNAEEILLSINEAFNKIDQSIDEELMPLLAHEFHHAKRQRSVGYGNTLIEAIISEGLADHFSIELTGVDPPAWSIAITGDELDTWIETASNSWNDNAYNHNDWFFGTNPDIPRWTGYSIGYKLVNDYLMANSDKLPSGLHTESAESFKP